MLEIVDLREDKTKEITFLGFVRTDKGYVRLKGKAPKIAGSRTPIRVSEFDLGRVKRIEIISDTKIKLVYRGGTETIFTIVEI